MRSLIFYGEVRRSWLLTYQPAYVAGWWTATHPLVSRNLIFRRRWTDGVDRASCYRLRRGRFVTPRTSATVSSRLLSATTKSPARTRFHKRRPLIRIRNPKSPVLPSYLTKPALPPTIALWFASASAAVATVVETVPENALFLRPLQRPLQQSLHRAFTVY